MADDRHEAGYLAPTTRLADLDWNLVPGPAGTGVKHALDSNGNVFIRSHQLGDKSPTLVYTADEWRAFTTTWLANPLGTLDLQCIPIGNGGGWSWRHNDQYLRFTDGEIQNWADNLRRRRTDPPRCPAERPGHRRGDRIIACHLDAGHPGEHEEADTEITWLDPPTQLCGAEYKPPAGFEPLTRTVTCGLPSGHSGAHSESADADAWWPDEMCVQPTRKLTKVDVLAALTASGAEVAAAVATRSAEAMAHGFARGYRAAADAIEEATAKLPDQPVKGAIVAHVDVLAKALRAAADNVPNHAAAGG